MAKDPAFLFYPNDYLGGTMGMTFEEKGAYMELLMLQFNRGHMTSHMIGQTVGQIWDKLEDKFIQDEKGNWYNIRLEEEIVKRKSFTASRRNNVSGKNQYSKDKKESGQVRGHMTSHMENENRNNNVLEYKEKGNGNFDETKMDLPLPAMKAGSVKELMKITKQIELSDSDINSFWTVFKGQNFTGKKYYGDVGDVYSHFINWMKTQNVKNPDKVVKQKIVLK